MNAYVCICICKSDMHTCHCEHHLRCKSWCLYISNLRNNVCMYPCIYVCTHVYMYALMCICMHSCIYVCTHIMRRKSWCFYISNLRNNVCMYACTYTSAICPILYARMHARTHACMSAYISNLTVIHTYMGMYIHTKFSCSSIESMRWYTCNRLNHVRGFEYTNSSKFLQRHM